MSFASPGRPSQSFVLTANFIVGHLVSKTIFGAVGCPIGKGLPASAFSDNVPTAGWIDRYSSASSTPHGATANPALYSPLLAKRDPLACRNGAEIHQ